MTTPTFTAQASDPWEMALIHRLIRRGFEQSRDLLRSADSSARAEHIAGYLDFHLTGLHAHHSTEDELLWPALRERAQLSDTLIERMEAKHTALHDGVERVRRKLGTWRADPSTAGSEAVAAAVDTVIERLDEHLAEEERDIVPQIATHVTQAEWDDLGQVAFSKFTPRQRFTAMGEMLTTADPEEAARMLAGLPIKIIWRLFGRRGYDRSMARLRGSN